jgi:hypothetical protein
MVLRFVKTSAYFVFALPLVTLPVAGLSAADTIRKVKGETITGDIVKETSQEIQINSGAKAQRIARREIAPDGIAYDGEPRELIEGKAALAQREFEKAHQNFQSLIQVLQAASGSADSGKNEKNEKNGKAKQKVAPKKAILSSAIRPIFLQHALYGEVQTYAAEGKADELGESVEALLKHAPDSFYLLEALLAKVGQAIDQGDEPKVAEAAKYAKERAAAAGVGAEVGDHIEILRAKYLLEHNKAKEAEGLYESLQKSPVGVVADMAKLGLAQIQLASGQIVPAKMTFNRLLRESKESIVKCSAHRGLGDAQMKEMQASRTTADGLREALESYLRAVVICFPAEGDSPEPYQQALLGAGACAEEMVAFCKKDPKNQKDAKPQDEYRKLARDLYNDVLHYFPQSEAAKKAREALGKLRAGASQ